ncbi:hypothetical protein ROLI_029030 [Roseobacter fucihabitans]|uniref:Glyoxalase-like domain-containing protein n=1 Tax=Roseobacter fucihabitans TaxID=1537242 RepID=A0ABZ2BWQ1_9RHOB|nr:VOC family protein [Roseobacter litoralis]MBC6964821.1 hypothetical protein [Roseobacter litoralis]
MELDHIAVAGATLEEATAHVESALGVAMQPGGQHDVFFTHNALLGLEDGLYLEAIAIDPTAAVPERARWFDLDRFAGPPRLSNWICRSADIITACAELPVDMGTPVALQRSDLRWRMAVPLDGILPFDNCAPALIQWDTPQHPARRLACSGVRLRRLTISHPEADRVQQLFAPRLGDDRLRFETGPAALGAVFDTPHGERIMA